MAFRYFQDPGSFGFDLKYDWTSFTGGISYDAEVLRTGSSFAGSFLENDTPFTNSLTKTLDLQTTWIYQMRFKNGAATSGNSDFLKFLDGSGNLRALLRYSTSDGTYKVILGDGTTVFASAAYELPANTVMLLEFKIVFATGGLGSATLKINGRVVFNQGGTTVLSGTVGATSIVFGNFNFTLVARTYFNDIIMMDGTGGSYNDFIGDRRVDLYLANGNGTYQDLNRSNPAVSAYQLVDDTTYSDTDYVYSDTDGAKSTFDCANMSHTPTIIDAARNLVIARRTDPGTANLKMVSKSGVTVTTGSTQSVGPTYTSFSEIFTTNPNTGTPWTVATFNAQEVGLEVDV